MLGAMLVLTGAAPAAAQTIRGILSDRDSYEAIDLAGVVLLTTEMDTLAQTITNEQGYFRFRAPDSGQYYLVASALGYRSVQSELIDIGEGQVQIVELSMASRPIPVEGVLVEADAEEPEVPGLVGTGFYERMAGGRGEFITPGQIRLSAAKYPQQLFWGMKTVRVHQASHDRPGIWNDVLVIPNRASRGYCAPSVYVDGVWIREWEDGRSIADVVYKDELEAVEVYEWPFGVPRQYQGEMKCGVILFWTKNR